MPLEHEPAVEPVKEEPKEDPKPDLDALLAEEREKSAESQKKLEDNQVAYDARMTQLETMLQNKFEAKPAPPVETPVVAAPSAEDFLTPEGQIDATRRIAREEAAAAANQMRKPLMETKAAQFDLKLEGMKTRKYYKYIEPALAKAVQENPNLRYAPEALDILYNNIAGSMMDEILEKEKTTEPVEDPKPVKTNLVAPRGNIPAPTAPVARAESGEPILSAAEESVRGKFAGYITGMRAENNRRAGRNEPTPEYTQEQYARSRNERAGILEDIPDLEEKNSGS